jgi:serine/threonine-protein kinase HipA
MTHGSNYSLGVYLGQSKVADLHAHHDRLSLSYDASWLKKGFAISPALPLTDQALTGRPVSAFFNNLLPEGQSFDDLVAYLGVSRSNVFALIRAIGKETSGALTFDNHVSERQLPSFTPLDLEELEKRLSHRDAFNLVVWEGKVRLSVAGEQDKLNILFNDTNMMGFGDGSLCSTNILKFEKHQDTYLVANEYLCLKLAKACGLNVTSSALMKIGQHDALLVERFDRRKESDSVVLKKHMIDSCQALGLPPSFKYERNLGSGRDVRDIRDGVSFAHLFELAGKCKHPAKTKLDILNWMAFNLIVSNFDAHGKNISFFVDHEGLSLAPFYDIVNIALFPDFEQSFAMAIGNNFDPSNINTQDLMDMAVDCNLSVVQIKARLRQMMDKVRVGLESLTEPNIALSYCHLFSDNIRKTCERLTTAIDG